MKILSTIIFSVCLLQTNSKSFRGILNAVTPDQDPHEIAPPGESFIDPTHQGDIPHAAARGASVIETAFVIQDALASGLRKEFGFLQESITKFADGDGFVREGIPFCNGLREATEIFIKNEIPAGYSSFTSELAANDGFGRIMPIVAEQQICGKSGCEEGSFVALIANRISSLGYYVTHSDICAARTDVSIPDTQIKTARTCKLESNSVVRRSWACPDTAYVNNNDLFQMNTLCFEGNYDSNACSKIKATFAFPNEDPSIKYICNYDTIEQVCFVRNEIMNNIGCVEKVSERIDNDFEFVHSDAHCGSEGIYNRASGACDDLCLYGKMNTVDKTCEDICSSGITPEDGVCQDGSNLITGGDYIEGGSVINATDIVESYGNAVRRHTSYGVIANGPTETTDKTYVTGVVDGGGCRTLRQYAAALNGNAQINAFRDKGVLEAKNNWNNIINQARSYLEAYAEISTNFYEMSLKIFPFIEYEEFDECQIGTTELQDSDYGARESPRCDNLDSTRDKLNSMPLSSQAIRRSKCFCRMGQMGPVWENEDEQYEFDEIYLHVDDTKIQDHCIKIVNLESAYQYCKSDLTETSRWKEVLRDLEPSYSALYTTKETSKATKEEIEAAKTKMFDQLEKTMPLVKHGYEPNCGRLITSHTGGPTNRTDMFSNKGANCLPFAKLNEIIYRLEFETSRLETGKVRNSAFERFADGLCRTRDKLDNTYYSFRQLAYKWDHPIDTDGHGAMATPVSSSLVDHWVNYRVDADIKGAQNRLKGNDDRDKLYWRYVADGISDSSDKVRTPMCFVDWTNELAGSTARKDFKGSSYDDPYELFLREVREAEFNVNVALAAKSRAISENGLIWDAIETDLTSVDTNRLSWDIAIEVAEHFMRIVTTDDNDDSVDSDDVGADKDEGELPNAMATGSAYSRDTNDEDANREAAIAALNKLNYEEAQIAIDMQNTALQALLSSRKETALLETDLLKVNRQLTYINNRISKMVSGSRPREERAERGGLSSSGPISDSDTAFLKAFGDATGSGGDATGTSSGEFWNDATGGAGGSSLPPSYIPPSTTIDNVAHCDSTPYACTDGGDNCAFLFGENIVLTSGQMTEIMTGSHKHCCFDTESSLPTTMTSSTETCAINTGVEYWYTLKAYWELIKTEVLSKIQLQQSTCIIIPQRLDAPVLITKRTINGGSIENVFLGEISHINQLFNFVLEAGESISFSARTGASLDDESKLIVFCGGNEYGSVDIIGLEETIVNDATAAASGVPLVSGLGEQCYVREMSSDISLWSQNDTSGVEWRVTGHNGTDYNTLAFNTEDTLFMGTWTKIYDVNSEILPESLYIEIDHVFDRSTFFEVMCSCMVGTTCTKELYAVPDVNLQNVDIYTETRIIEIPTEWTEVHLQIFGDKINGAKHENLCSGITSDMNIGDRIQVWNGAPASSTVTERDITRASGDFDQGDLLCDIVHTGISGDGKCFFDYGPQGSIFLDGDAPEFNVVMTRGSESSNNKPIIGINCQGLDGSISLVPSDSEMGPTMFERIMLTEQSTTFNNLETVSRTNFCADFTCTNLKKQSLQMYGDGSVCCVGNNVETNFIIIGGNVVTEANTPDLVEHMFSKDEISTIGNNMEDSQDTMLKALGAELKAFSSVNNIKVFRGSSSGTLTVTTDASVATPVYVVYNDKYVKIINTDDHTITA